MVELAFGAIVLVVCVIVPTQYISDVYKNGTALKPT